MHRARVPISSARACTAAATTRARSGVSSSRLPRPTTSQRLACAWVRPSDFSERRRLAGAQQLAELGRGIRGWVLALEHADRDGVGVGVCRLVV